jgi:hypothetical protein
MTWQDVITDHWAKLARIKQWAGVMALQGVEDHHAEQMKNIQAENAMNRQVLTGQSQSKADEEVRQTILGDYNVTQQPRPSINWSRLLLGGGMLAMGAGLPASAYFIADAIKNRPVESNTTIEQPATEDTDTTIKLSLPDLPDT